MKHTKGPWKIEKNDLIGDAIWSEKANITICAMPVNEADGILIHAAPDLLFACKIARAYVAKMVADNINTAIPPARALQIIQNAIEKAESQNKKGCE